MHDDDGDNDGDNDGDYVTCRCAISPGGSTDPEHTAERSECGCRRHSDHRVCGERLAGTGGDVVSLRRTVTMATTSAAQWLVICLP